MTFAYDDSALQSICVPNTQTVDLYPATTDSSFDTPVSVTYALRRAPTKAEQDMYPNIEVVWHLWERYLDGTVPKIRDVVQDANGDRWQASQVLVQAWHQRYRLMTFRENY